MAAGDFASKQRVAAPEPGVEREAGLSEAALEREMGVRKKRGKNEKSEK